jgi:hypothetical protein
MANVCTRELEAGLFGVARRKTRGCGFGQAKIQGLNLPVGCDPDAGRFEVAVDDALFVRGLQAGGDLACVIQRRLERQWATEVRTFDQIHHDGAVLEAIDCPGVGMVQRLPTPALRV